jgi:hypothetical protein
MTETATVRIAANHAVTKRLGNWTTARSLQVRVRHGSAVLDLRSAQIPDGDILIETDLDHATLTVLLADDAAIDDWNLQWIGRGRLKDAEAPKVPGKRRIVLNGRMRHSEIRVRRNGRAVLSAMFSRAFLADLRQARSEGRMPSVADPTPAA